MTGKYVPNSELTAKISQILTMRGRYDTQGRSFPWSLQAGIVIHTFIYGSRGVNRVLVTCYTVIGIARYVGEITTV